MLGIASPPPDHGYEVENPMQARTRNLLAVALAAAVFSPLALAQSVNAHGAVNGAVRGQAQIPTTPATPQAPTLPTGASTRADTAVSAAMQREAPPPADGTELQDAQQQNGRASGREKGCQYG